MTIHRTLRNGDAQQILTMLQDLHGRRVDLVVPTKDLSLQDGRLVVNNVLTDDGFGPITFELLSTFHSGLAEYTGIHISYLRKLLAEEVARHENVSVDDDGTISYQGISLLDINANYWLERLARNLFLRGYADPEAGYGLARALLSDRFRVIDNFDVALAVWEEIQPSNSGLDVQLAHADLTDESMYLYFRVPSVTRDGGPFVHRYQDPRSGRSGRDYPIVEAGFVVRNGELGGGAAKVVPRLVVQVCTNGMTRHVDAQRAIHLGSKMEVGMIDWSNETAERNLELIVSQVKDAVRTFCTASYLDKVIDEWNDRGGQQLDNPEAAVAQVAKSLNWSEDRRAAVMASFIGGGQVTVGGIVAAASNVALGLEDADQAYGLERDAEKVFDLLAV